MTERTYKLSEEKRRYHADKAREYRRRARAKMPPKKPKPAPQKPTKALRQESYGEYMKRYMRWWRANGPVRGLDPDGKDWAT
jgi:hypothetical protein